MTNLHQYFQRGLMRWNASQNNRVMPWKAEKDPYKIWLSEIILQQTRVEQGWDYYTRFVKAFPDIGKLAKAPEEQIYKMWEGLGYYTRCKNLIATAKYIAYENQGIFPQTFAEILNLKGVGPYTAAAIASFAYNLPHAVVDGNVFRVLSRFFGLDTPVDSNNGKKVFTELAAKLLHKKQPGIYNQAIMDFGAVVCKPRNPACSICPVRAKCRAFAEGNVDKLPVKTGKISKVQRWFNYLVIEHRGKFYVRKRTAGEIWENLYEFVLLETPVLFSAEMLINTPFFKNITGKKEPVIVQVSKLYKQQLTHQTLYGNFIQLKTKQKPLLTGYTTVTYDQLLKLPFPKLITAYLAENKLMAYKR